MLVAAVVWAPETLHRAAAPARQLMLLSAYPRLLTDRRFLRLSLYSALLFASFYSFVAGVPIVIIDLWGHSALAFGAWWTIGSLAYILGNYLAGRYSQAFGVERMLRFGEPLIGGGAVLLLILLALGPQHPLAVFVPIGIIFTGSGIAQPNAISGAINVDVDVVGSASALLGCMQILFGIVAVTLLGALRLTRLHISPGSAREPSCLRSSLIVCCVAKSRRPPPITGDRYPVTKLKVRAWFTAGAHTLRLPEALLTVLLRWNRVCAFGQSASGTFVLDLNEREGAEKVGRNDARRTAAINYLRLESSHSAFGHFGRCE